MNQPSTIQAKSTQHGIVPGADIVKFEIKNMYKFSVARLFQKFYRREMRKKFSDHFFCRSAVLLACAKGLYVAVPISLYQGFGHF